MRLQVWPCTSAAACEWVFKLHRHLPDVEGCLFACAIGGGPDESQWNGVALAGNPARVWQGTGRVVISRVATDGVPQGCSMLYGAICRAAKALGYAEAWTYTTLDEPGTSLRAAGFIYKGLGKGGEHDREGRPRKAVVDDRPKHRWMRKLSDVAPWPTTVKVKEKPVDPQGLLWEVA